MRTKTVKSVPEIKYFDASERDANEVQAMLERFHKLKTVRCIQVIYEEGEYSSACSLVRAIRYAIKACCYSMRVHMRGNEVYVEKL